MSPTGVCFSFFSAIRFSYLPRKRNDVTSEVKMCLAMLATLAPSGIFLKTHLSRVLDPFHNTRHPRNFGSVIGGHLLKWNLMSSEWEWLLLCFKGVLICISPIIRVSFCEFITLYVLVMPSVEDITRRGPLLAPASHRDLSVMPST